MIGCSISPTWATRFFANRQAEWKNGYQLLGQGCPTTINMSANNASLGASR